MYVCMMSKKRTRRIQKLDRFLHWTTDGWHLWFLCFFRKKKQFLRNSHHQILLNPSLELGSHCSPSFWTVFCDCSLYRANQNFNNMYILPLSFPTATQQTVARLFWTWAVVALVGVCACVRTLDNQQTDAMNDTCLLYTIYRQHKYHHTTKHRCCLPDIIAHHRWIYIFCPKIERKLPKNNFLPSKRGQPTTTARHLNAKEHQLKRESVLDIEKLYITYG